MKLLLDTHAFLWLVEGSSDLSHTAETALSDAANDLFLSAASVWELAIKVGNKKLVLRDPLPAFINMWTTTYQLKPLAIQSIYAFAVLNLPAHHKDPFDRMLIAQALVEGLTLVTIDRHFEMYGAPILW